MIQSHILGHQLPQVVDCHADHVSGIISVLVIMELPLKSVCVMICLPIIPGDKTRWSVGGVKYLLCLILHLAQQVHQLHIYIWYLTVFPSSQSAL